MYLILLITIILIFITMNILLYLISKQSDIFDVISFFDEIFKLNKSNYYYVTIDKIHLIYQVFHYSNINK